MGTLPAVKLASTEWAGSLGCNSAHPSSPAPLLLQGSCAACLALGGGRMLPAPARVGRRMLRFGKLRRGLNPHGFSSCFLPLQPQLGGGAFPLQSSTGSSGSPQPRSNASEKRNKVGARPWEWRGRAAALPWRSLQAAPGSPALDLSRLGMVLPSRDLPGTTLTNTPLPFILHPFLRWGN